MKRTRTQQQKKQSSKKLEGRSSRVHAQTRCCKSFAKIEQVLEKVKEDPGLAEIAEQLASVRENCEVFLAEEEDILEELESARE